MIPGQPSAVASASLPRDYRRWFRGTAVASIGSGAFVIALQWAATAHGGTAAATVLACGIGPQMVLLMVGGTIVDRVGPKRVMTTALVTMVVVSLSLATVARFVDTALWVLILYSTVSGVVNGFYLPASMSMVRRLVADDQLSRAHATQQAGLRMAAFVAAPLGGVLASGDLAVAAVVNAAALALVMATLAAVRPAFTPPPPADRTPVGAQLRDGIRLVARDPLLRTALLFMAAAAAFLGPVVTLFVPLLVREHGWDATAVGWLIGAEGLAFFVVAAAISRRGTVRRLGVGAAAGIVVAGAGAISIALMPNLFFGLAGALVVGAGYGLAATHLTPLVVTASPPTHLSRTTAMMGIVQNVGIVTTFFGFGGLADSVGPRPVAVVDGLLLVAVGVLAVTSGTLRRA
ncbi:MFS transporter [Phytohabitans sp. LJ34]|uniref:MFS transporter n=1 Tax=Phytohabitans sp. LJ34 TaxID=3452217 RepID=UPI003F88D875